MAPEPPAVGGWLLRSGVAVPGLLEQAPGGEGRAAPAAVEATESAAPSVDASERGLIGPAIASASTRFPLSLRSIRPREAG
jgi:hypothetical protein